jgi:threonine/homoserine/homoserine lactone efflux protein
VGALPLSSAGAFTVLKHVGAACLLHLGVRSLLDARGAARASVTSAGAEPQAPITSGEYLRQLMSRVVLDRVSGAALVGLGSALALTGRSRPA